MKFFLYLASCLLTQFYAWGVIVWGKFSPGLNFPEYISLGRDFSVEVDPDFLALFKTWPDIQIKKKFFQLKVRSYIKT